MTTKVMVSFPDEFLHQVDRIAQEEHRSRSELVREALRVYMGLREEQRPPGANPFARQAVAVQDSGGRQARGKGEGSTAEVREMREAPDGAHGTLAAQDRQIARELQQRHAKLTPIRCQKQDYGEMIPLSQEIAEEMLHDARLFVLAIETHLRATGHLVDVEERA